MELTKEIELFILTRISQKREVSEKDFNQLFAKHTVIVRKGKKDSCTCLSFLYPVCRHIPEFYLETANRHFQSPGSGTIMVK